MYPYPQDNIDKVQNRFGSANKRYCALPPILQRLDLLALGVLLLVLRVGVGRVLCRLAETREVERAEVSDRLGQALLERYLGLPVEIPEGGGDGS